MLETKEILLKFPQIEKEFCVLDSFLEHKHDLVSANQLYVIPWENGFFVTSRRNADSSGCVGCLVRRLLSTTYHKSHNIERIDSVFYPEFVRIVEATFHEYSSLFQTGVNSTLCWFFKAPHYVPQEFHVLPVPGCECSQKALPELENGLAEKWIRKWPNVLCNRHYKNEIIHSFHILTSRLPNTAPLFLRYPDKYVNVGSAATAADFRDSNNLEIRTIGEAIERYACTYLPPALMKNCEIHRTFEIVEGRSMFIENFFGEIKAVSSDRVYSGLYRIRPDKFKPISSSGVAAHTTLKEAKISAALELIERDALINAWRLSDREEISSFFSLPFEYLNEIRELAWLKKLARDQMHEVYIIGVKNQLHLPLTLVYTTPVSDHGSSPNIGVGIGFNWSSSIRKALCETLQGIANPDFEILEGNPKTFNERPRFWKSKERLEILKRRLNPRKEKIALESFTKNYTFLDLDVSFLSNIYFAELTPPDVALANWYVIRALCEQFEPFPGSYVFEEPNFQRINSFLAAQNYDPIEHINIDPFPYP